MNGLFAAGPMGEDFARFPVDYIHPARAGEWLPGLPESLVRGIAANARLREKASAIILSAYGLPDCSEPLDAADGAIAVLPLEMLNRIAVMAGSIWNANWLRLVVSRKVLAEVFGESGFAHYAFAISQAHLAGSRRNLPANAQEVAAAVLSGGNGCLLSWVDSLPASVKGRVWLKFPRDYIQPPLPEGCSADAARHIVRVASQHFQSCQ